MNFQCEALDGKQKQIRPLTILTDRNCSLNIVSLDK